MPAPTIMLADPGNGQGTSYGPDPSWVDPLKGAPAEYAKLSPEQKAEADARMYANYWGSPQKQIEDQFGKHADAVRQFYYEQARSNPEWGGLTPGEQLYAAGEKVKGSGANPFNTEAGVAGNRQEKANDVAMKADTGDDGFGDIMKIAMLVAAVYTGGAALGAWGGAAGATSAATAGLIESGATGVA